MIEDDIRAIFQAPFELYILVVHVGHVSYLNLISNKQLFDLFFLYIFLYIPFWFSTFSTCWTVSEAFGGRILQRASHEDFDEFIDYPLLRCFVCNSIRE